MNRLFLVGILQIVASFGFAQTNISPNVLAAPFQGQHLAGKPENNDVEGTPLLFDDWKAGEVTLKNGENYHLDKINFDASAGKFIYSKDEAVYEFAGNIDAIKIYGENHAADTVSDMLFRTDLLPENPGFVQVLLKGKITIIRELSKKAEGENYSNGIVNNTRKYVLRAQDFAIKDNKTIPFKYSASALDELASDKKSQVDSYVKSNNLKLKKESDFLKSINFYNTLNSSTN